MLYFYKSGIISGIYIDPCVVSSRKRQSRLGLDTVSLSNFSRIRVDRALDAPFCTPSLTDDQITLATAEARPILSDHHLPVPSSPNRVEGLLMLEYISFFLKRRGEGLLTEDDSNKPTLDPSRRIQPLRQ
ncbi:unnamed protein product [Protopolystoma xenopodis]|uniref:Uncharacterized protein n=1 Tax=Protopolystoma xenopodis TaxID=117903 RepID=A0A3S5AAV9_9PLAT|nr:unnamed protein product [Protopolystoma xenopodis]